MTTELRTKLMQIAAQIVRREYVPALDECRTIHDAREEVHRMSDRHAKLGLKIAELARAVSPSLESRDRTPQDYAIEHAEYLAKAVEGFLEALGKRDMARDEADSEELNDAEMALSDHWNGLQTSIYEFRKRAFRAAPPATETQPEWIASPSTVTQEARGLMRVCCRMIWAREHGLRVGRDDAEDGSAYVMRLAHSVGLLPEINGSKFRDFCEQLTGLSWGATETAPQSQPTKRDDCVRCANSANRRNSK